MPPPSPILVTGATGFTGQVLVRKLAAAGAEVRAIARASSDLTPLDGVPVTWHRGDVFDPEVVSKAMDGARTVIHVAALYRQAGAPDDLYRRVHVDSTRLLAEAAARQDGFARFVHVSTVGVHGHIEHPPADEDAPFDPGDIYQATKAEAEVWIRAHAPELGIDAVVLRPAGIMGPSDRRLLKVFRLATGPVFPLLGKGACLYHLIHVEDLADIMIRAASHPEARGQTLICGNPEPIPLEAMGRIVADELGTRFRPLRLPAGPFMAAAAVCEAVCRPFGLPPPLHRRRVAFYTKDRAFDTSRLRRVLGYEVRFDNEAGIRDTARGYVERGWLKARRA